MTSINKILVVIDPTAASQPALERIARLPRPLNAQLMLLICDYEPNLGVGYADSLPRPSRPLAHRCWHAMGNDWRRSPRR